MAVNSLGQRLLAIENTGPHLQDRSRGGPADRGASTRAKRSAIRRGNRGAAQREPEGEDEGEEGGNCNSNAEDLGRPKKELSAGGQKAKKALQVRTF